VNNENIQPDSALQNPTESDTLANGLNDKQLAAIDLLLAGKTIVSTAQAVGVSRQTVHVWLKDELFLEVRDNRRREMWDHAAERLRAMVHPSLNIVERELKNPYDRARWRAATAVLRLADLRKTVLNGQSQ